MKMALQTGTYWTLAASSGKSSTDPADQILKTCVRWKSWSPDNLPILPERFRVRTTKHGAAQMRVLRQLMNASEVTAIVNACDAGREGELIFRRVYELARCRKPIARLWISARSSFVIVWARWPQLQLPM